MHARRWFAFVLAVMFGTWARPAAAEEVRVLAASSVQDVMTEVARRYAADTGRPAPTLAFAASSEVARQVGHGAPAHVVVTADADWMATMVAQGSVVPDSVVSLAANRMVVVVPSSSGQTPEALFDTVQTLAVAAPEVPAGRRAREALRSLGVLEGVQSKFVVGRNARATLALADRDEVDAAIVYRSDALASPGVRVVLALPSDSHAAISYPAALTAAAGEDATAFFDYLRSPAATAVFAEAGFDAVAQASDVPAWRHQADGARGLGPIWRTLWVAALSLLLSVVPAVFLGWVLARREFVGKTALSTLLMTPLVLPPVVIGFLLLELFGRNGPLAGLFDALGVQIAFTRWGAVVAAAVVGFPLLTLMSRLAIEAVDAHYEQVAQTLGLTRLQAFVRVGLPMSAPGLLAGCVLAYARALGEFGATAVLATDVPGETRTLALAIFALYEQPGLESAAHTLVWTSIVLCGLALLAYERLSKWQKTRLSGA
jgi:molybdate transport system permease protein